MTTTPTIDDHERFMTVKRLVQLPAYRGWLTEASVRHLIFAARPRLNSKGVALPTNGLERAIVKIGRKVLIDRDEFERWVELHRLSGNDFSALNG